MAGLTANKLWNACFTKHHLKSLFDDKIKNKASLGLDWITAEKFEESIDENINIILRKCRASTYSFTNYRELLISKGAGKPPRCISIPTVRDKLVFAALSEILSNVYGSVTAAPMPQMIIKEITDELQQSSFDTYIKIDIKSFYASIDHGLLMKALRKKIRKKEICTLIERAIETNTAQPNSLSSSESRDAGVPEGLSISNALANIYMQEIDNKYSHKKGQFRYWRYVDDILILTSTKEVDSIKAFISSDIIALKLKANTDKTIAGVAATGFEYLGYRISKSSVSVRQSSVINLERTLEMIFRNYSASPNRNGAYLQWKINLKISGFIIDKHKYGWLFFYSQINDLSLLAHLDWLIGTLCTRFRIEEKIHFKTFLRSYNEISKALHTTSYIPNLDLLSVPEKRRIVQEIYGENVKNKDDNFIEMHFRKLMNKEIRDIQKDVQPFS